MPFKFNTVICGDYGSFHPGEIVADSHPHIDAIRKLAKDAPHAVTDLNPSVSPEPEPDFDSDSEAELSEDDELPEEDDYVEEIDEELNSTVEEKNVSKPKRKSPKSK